MTLFFFDAELLVWIEKLGFPIVLVLVLTWFLFKVWQYVTSKLDERDKFLIRQIEHNEKFADDIIDTQKTHGSILGDIRDILKQQ